MTSDLGQMEIRLERLTKATEGVVPSPGFGARVMEAVGAQPRGNVTTWIARLGRFTIPAAAMVATALAVWAIESNGEYEDAVMVASYDLEQDW